MIWEEIKLDEICNVINGGAWSQEEYVSSGVKVIKVSNLVNDGIDESTLSFLPFEALSTYEKNILKAYDLVITTVGSHPQLKASAAGRGFIIPANFEGALLNQNTVCIRTKDENILHSRYLGYIGRSDDFRNYIQQTGRGAANQMRIPISNLKSFNINLPPLETQKRIASILSNYDDLIENNNKRISLLEETAQNIYKEWFVNFRFPNYENTEFDKESGLPVGWGKKKVINFFDFVKGIEVGSKNYLNDEAINTVPFLRVGDISKRDGGIFVYQELVKDKTVDVNDILISFDGSIGNIGYGLFGAYSSGLRKILDKNDSFGKTFSLCLMKSDEIQQTIKAHAKGSTILHAGSSIQYLEFVKPSDEILRKYKNLNEPFFDEIINLTVQNQKLKEARDIMLPRLMNRTIEV